MLIDSPIKIVPVTLDCDVSLVDTPRAADGSREPTPTLLELGRVANNPAHDGGVRNHNRPLRHHRSQVSITQLVRNVPAHTQNYDLGVEVPLQINRITFQPLGHQRLPRRPHRTTLRRCTRTAAAAFAGKPTGEYSSALRRRTSDQEWPRERTNCAAADLAVRESSLDKRVV